MSLPSPQKKRRRNVAGEPFTASAASLTELLQQDRPFTDLQAEELLRHVRYEQSMHRACRNLERLQRARRTGRRSAAKAAQLPLFGEAVPA